MPGVYQLSSTQLVAFSRSNAHLADGKNCPPDGRLPDASKGPQHIRDIFYRMGFNDQACTPSTMSHVRSRSETYWHAVRSGLEFTVQCIRALHGSVDQSHEIVAWEGGLCWEVSSPQIMHLRKLTYFTLCPVVPLSKSSMLHVIHSFCKRT